MDSASAIPCQKSPSSQSLKIRYRIPILHHPQKSRDLLIPQQAEHLRTHGQRIAPLNGQELVILRAHGAADEEEPCQDAREAGGRRRRANETPGRRARRLALSRVSIEGRQGHERKSRKTRRRGMNTYQQK